MAQTSLPYNSMSHSSMGGYTQYPPLNDSVHPNKKWSLNKYAAISMSYGFYKGGNSSGISIPFGLQLNRRLNNNLYAFAGVSAAPVFYNVNSAILNSNFSSYHPGGPYVNNKGLSMNARVEAGLMYVNPDRTFSISGSIGVEKSSYPAYPYYYQAPAQKQ